MLLRLRLEVSNYAQGQAMWALTAELMRARWPERKIAGQEVGGVEGGGGGQRPQSIRTNTTKTGNSYYWETGDWNRM